MKQSTIKRYTEILMATKASKKSLHAYCNDEGLNYNSITTALCNIRKQYDEESEEIKYLLDLYDDVTGKPKGKKLEDIHLDEEDSEINIIRDNEGKIVSYSYNIKRKNQLPLIGRLSRAEMELIHRLYSYYGDSLPQRTIARYFIDLSLIDFKRILKAFNITKASSPFAPHTLEEKTEEELRDLQIKEKENSFLRKAEEDQIRVNERLLKKFAQENIELRRQLNDASKLNVKFPEYIEPVILPEYQQVGQNLNLYLSDIHLGAALTTGALYQENLNYGYDEAKRRLTVVLERLRRFGYFDTINLVLLGDNIDCAGVAGKTARLDHVMPQNMDPMEQANSFMDLMMWFISSLADERNEFCSHLNIYSVPEGNHGGNFEHMCNMALLSAVSAQFPNVGITLWNEFFGIFEQNGEIFICCHGKDAQYMKKGLPLYLDDKTKIKLYEWLHENGIHQDNVHFIKGDLHSNSLSSCKRLDYRNVLSLFGASDYSNYNFSRNSYGVSYDLFIGDNLVRGTFENI